MRRLAQVMVSSYSADPSLRWFRNLGLPGRKARASGLRSVSAFVVRGVAACLLLAVAAAAVGCRTAQSPQLHVIGVHEEPRHDVVFVQVTNPVGRAMRLTRLEYRFAAAGQTVSTGEMALARELPAGAAIVVEVPLDTPPAKLTTQPMTLYGKLTAELDQIVQSFSVSAQIAPQVDDKSQ
jgi:hypothetical protein